MQGKIVSTLGNIYTVYVNGITCNVIPKGIFKYKNEHLCVGDNVEFDDTNFVITNIESRTNELIRPRCANIDQLFIVMSISEPELSIELLYKFLTYANMNGIKAKVVFTKMDLIKDDSNIKEIKNDLERIGYEVYFVNENDCSGFDVIKNTLNGKVTIFMGQTGVGKSSLINHLSDKFNRKIGSYSAALGRGKHQTKEVVLLPFEDGFVADTPGFSSLDLNLFKEDLAQFFPGYNSLYTQCYFSNCLHQNEKQCKIKSEIDKGNLSKESYEIYLKLLNSLEYKSRRFEK